MITDKKTDVVMMVGRETEVKFAPTARPVELPSLPPLSEAMRMGSLMTHPYTGEMFHWDDSGAPQACAAGAAYAGVFGSAPTKEEAEEVGNKFWHSDPSDDTDYLYADMDDKVAAELTSTWPSLSDPIRKYPRLQELHKALVYAGTDMPAYEPPTVLSWIEVMNDGEYLTREQIADALEEAGL